MRSSQRVDWFWLLIGAVLGASVVHLFSIRWWPDVPYAPLLLLSCLALWLLHSAFNGRFHVESLPHAGAAYLTSSILTISSIHGSISATAFLTVMTAFAWKFKMLDENDRVSITNALAGAALAQASLNTVAEGIVFIDVVTILLALGMIVQTLNNQLYWTRSCAVFFGGAGGSLLFRYMNGNIEFPGSDAAFHFLVAVAFLLLIMNRDVTEEE